MLDLYVPEKVKNPALVIMIHGGQFLFGDKKDENVSLFLDAGFAVASINYRLSGEALFPAQIIDCKAAVRWLRTHAKTYGYDPTRIRRRPSSRDAGNLLRHDNIRHG